MPIENSFTETTHSSWLGRLGQTIMGALLGIVLFFGSIFLLFWNEGRAVDAIVALDAGAKTVESLPNDRLLRANDGKLVHISGPVVVEDQLRDDTFGVTATNTMRLRRTVEMYQWRQTEESKTEKSVGGGETTTTTYNYDRIWSSDYIESSDFRRPDGHYNPPMPYRTEVFTSEETYLGKFHMHEGQLAYLQDFENFPQPRDSNHPNDFRWQDGYLVRSDNLNQPNVGDLRISYSYIPAQTLSAIGEQNEGGIWAFEGERGVLINIVKTGSHTAEEMFQQAKDEEAMLTWLLRALGLGLMVVSMILMTSPLTWLASVIPFVETLVGGVTMFTAMLISIPLSLLVIASAWLFYRPIIGLSIIAVAVLAIIAERYWLKRPSRDKAAA